MSASYSTGTAVASATYTTLFDATAGADGDPFVGVEIFVVSGPGATVKISPGPYPAGVVVNSTDNPAASPARFYAKPGGVITKIEARGVTGSNAANVGFRGIM